jgi:hypothetical protein
VVYPRPDLMTTIGHAARELGDTGRYERPGTGGGLESTGAMRRLDRPGRLTPLRPRPARHRRMGRRQQNPQPAATSPPRRVPRSPPDVCERRPLVQPVSRRARGIGQAPHRQRIRRRQAPAGQGATPEEARRVTPCAKPSGRMCAS